MFGIDILAHAQQIGEVAGERVGLSAHSRDHGAEHDGGAQRAQCILGLHDQRRRRFVPHPLQGGEDFDDHGAALVERFAKQPLALVERLEARLRRLDAGLDVAHARGGIDELLIERAPIVGNRRDLALELLLVLGRDALPGARGIELLIMLPERVGIHVQRHARQRSAKAGGFGRRGIVSPRRRVVPRGIGRRQRGWRRAAGQKPTQIRAQGADRCGSTGGESSFARVDPSLRKARPSRRHAPAIRRGLGRCRHNTVKAD